MVVFRCLRVFLFVALIFAVVQFFDDYETALHRLFKKLLTSKDTRELTTIAIYGVWGLAIGFVISMFLFAVLLGTAGSYDIPMLFSAESSSAGVVGSTTIVSLTTLLGIVYGIWHTRH